MSRDKVAGIPESYLALHDFVSNMVESPEYAHIWKRVDHDLYDKALSLLSACNRAHEYARKRVRYTFTIGSDGDPGAGVHGWEDQVTVEFTGVKSDVTTDDIELLRSMLSEWADGYCEVEEGEQYVLPWLR